MCRIHRALIAVLALAFLASCAAPTAAPTPEPTPIPKPATPQPPTPIPSTATPGQPVPLPLSGPGPLAVGMRRNVEYSDPSRGGRKVTLTIWYPAEKSAGSMSGQPVADAAPDRSGAPYPLVLSSSKMGFTFAPHLASYGFVVAGINGQDAAHNWGQWLTDYPRDITFALDQIASASIEGLDGMIDTEHAGAMGYSFDSFTSLSLGGARIDPEFYLGQCAKSAEMSPAPPAWWLDYICNMPGGWDAFVANAGPAITSTTDGLWQPISDPRIRAVIPMGPEGAWIFGERGLAAADRAILIIAAGDDQINIYDLEAAYIFDHLGTPDRAMISFLGQGHMMVYDQAQVARMRHFAAAFFSVQLQHRDEFAKYLSEDFVSSYSDLAWVPRKNP